VPNSAGAIGAAHLALAVNDIHAAIARVEAAGWKVGGLCFRPRSYHDRAYAAASPLMGRRSFYRFTILSVNPACIHKWSL
jgi:hypothetical protein